jgi:glyceraldehyde 3-phosphate dehydrogenase
MIRVAINGFGRIGRTAFRILTTRSNVEVVAINDLADAATLAHLLKYDSNYGLWSGHTVASTAEGIMVDGQTVRALAEKDAPSLPWGELAVDVVIECTGKFLERDQASQHLSAGAKGVVLSAPGKGESPPPIFVRGVNDQALQGDTIISNASCTTNCLAPTIEVLESNFGVEASLMTTVHAYTSDQRLQDADHKDLRRARAAAVNIVPTSTGAAKAVSQAVPSLANKFDGVSLRVPVAVGSISDITALLKRSTSVDEVNEAFRRAAVDPRYQGILTVTDEPIVSSDIIGSPYSAIVDLGLTKVIGGLVKVFAWYDNEYGYTMRLVEMTELLGSKLQSR